MKRIIFILVLAVGFTDGYCQENNLILSGGYAFVTGEEVNADLSGWRVNGVYEFVTSDGGFSHGIGVGYASTSGPSTITGETDRTAEVGTLPIYYQPKFIFGDNKVQGFLKGAIGWQFASMSLSGGVLGTVSANDNGFMGGGGAGAIVNINSNFFLQAEYEITWMSNYYFYDGWLNNVMGGIGYRF